MDAIDHETLLEWWFGDAAADFEALTARQDFWFQGGSAVDTQIRLQFGEVFTAASEGELSHWAETARGRLALIIVLDQFSRNLNRGSAAAFANDSQSYRYCIDGLSRGDDLKLALVERIFFYLPLEHAEDLEAQKRCLKCYQALLAAAPEGWKGYFSDTLQYATMHYDIVKRFGRFPHRNQVLGRQATAAEQAYLAEDAPRFGQ